MITYTRKYEILRTVPQPPVLHLLDRVSARALLRRSPAPNRNDQDLAGSGISAPLYYMVGLAAFGTMNAVLSTGARIAGERAVGWNRQLRLTPLSTRAYFRAKVLTAYLMALITIVLLYAAGISLGVRLPAGEWVRMTGLILVGLIPFVALGILMGHLLTTDSIGPAMGGTTALLALLGGIWFPISDAARCTTSPRRCRRTGSCRRATSRSAAAAGARRLAHRRGLDGASSPPSPAAAYQRDTKRV